MTGQSKKAIDIVLAESIKELAEGRAIEKITIKEITDKAGVIRPTFYNHFQDKYELIEYIISSELLEPIKPLVTAGMMTEAMVLIFTNMSKDKIFYNKLVKMEGPITFREIALKCVKEFLLETIIESGMSNEPKHKWLTPEVVATYYAQSMCFATEGWINMGMSIEPREMAEAYYYMISRSMEEVVKNL